VHLLGTIFSCGFNDLVYRAQQRGLNINYNAHVHHIEGTSHGTSVLVMV